jgi:hypothetical protein
MTLPLSDVLCTTFTGGLGTLRSVLEAVDKHAAGDAAMVAQILQGRLAPDMFTFAQQVQAATDSARRVTDRLSGGEPSSMPDPESTIAALIERVGHSVERVAAADRAAIDATTDREMTIDLGVGPMKFTGRSYVLGFALPNFLFHVTTAYAILRHQGAPLGKALYVMPFGMACNS